MPGIIKRIINIARSKTADTFEKYMGGNGTEKRQEGKYYHEDGQYSSGYGQNFSHNEGSVKNSGYPEQVVEDLRIFGLVPPSDLNAVKKARNREIMKYHSDRFINDPEKLETSRQIMQIINLAYERLEEWFGS